MVCCNDEDQPHYPSSTDGLRDMFPQLRVGTCDWDYTVYNCVGGRCQGNPLANGAFKLGTAWATCECKFVAGRQAPTLMNKFVGGLSEPTCHCKWLLPFATRKGLVSCRKVPGCCLGHVCVDLGLSLLREQLLLQSNMPHSALHTQQWKHMLLGSP